MLASNYFPAQHYRLKPKPRPFGSLPGHRNPRQKFVHDSFDYSRNEAIDEDARDKKQDVEACVFSCFLPLASCFLPLKLLKFLRLLQNLVDTAYHIKCLLGDFIVLTGEDFLERTDRVVEIYVSSFTAGELFGDVKRLR